MSTGRHDSGKEHTDVRQDLHAGGCRLIWGDCLEEIRKVPDGCIKAIITDPPYFIGLNANGLQSTYEDLNIARPFYEPLIREFARVLAPDGCLYFFTDWRTYPFYFRLIDPVLHVDNLLVWDKKSGPGTFYTNEHELIIFHTNNRSFRGKGCRNIIRGIPGFSAGAKKRDGEKIHPTQKPTELIMKLIEDSTRPGDLVMDCFSGSGTTAVCCIRSAREFVGYEINERYFASAIERLIQEEQTNGFNGGMEERCEGPPQEAGAGPGSDRSRRSPG